VQFDRRQRFNDPQLKRCPECGEDALRKLYQPVGIVFKGSGFYATDHRSPSGRSAAKQADKEKGKADSGSDSSGGDSPGSDPSSES
jgi:putative FmdB family regulatory protein